MTDSPETQSPHLQADASAAFYIQSRVHNADWVLARTPTGRVRLAHKTGELGQLWRRLDDRREGFFLVNVETDEVLTQTRFEGGEVVLKQKNISDPLMLWRLDRMDGGAWIGLTAFTDWEQKLNLAGNGPYNESTLVCMWGYSGGAPNERWQMIPDTCEMVVESLRYDLANARMPDLKPELCVATAVDNRDGTTQIETTVELTRARKVTRRFTYNSSVSEVVTIAHKLGAKLTFDAVVELSGEIAVEKKLQTGFTVGEETESSTADSDKLTARVKVPGGRHYEFMVRVYYGTVSVPYTATISRVLPDGSRKNTTITGTYTNMNAVKNEIVARDLTNGTPQPVPAKGVVTDAPIPVA
jgi:hypothetical protein